MEVVRMDRMKKSIMGTARVRHPGVREARLRWFGCIGRRMLEMELPGRRKRERPKRRFLDVVKEDKQ